MKFKELQAVCAANSAVGMDLHSVAFGNHPKPATMRINSFFTVAAIAALFATPARAQYSTPMAGSNDYQFQCYNSAELDQFSPFYCNSNNNAIWHVGDYWQKTVFTGLPSTASISWSFEMLNWQSLNFDVFVNGTDVGDWRLSGDPAIGSVALNTTIGSAFTIRWQLKEGLCEGCGALELENYSQSTLWADGPVVDSTPEPASVMLLGTGLVGVATLTRRRKRSAR
ncbi:MAG: PEP-CTERM sorting domain-containing protein [Gemmatimonadota bacterium]